MANFLIYCLILTIEVSKCSEFKSISFIICIFTILSQESGPLAIRGCLRGQKLPTFLFIIRFQQLRCQNAQNLKAYQFTFEFLQF